MFQMIGPLVEPPAPLVQATAPPGRQAGMDFSIGDLFFKVAEDDQNPYQRQTAQFKKDQFDASPEYSDQSLLGYWTRGQFSFHRGEGVKYYEVSDPSNSVEFRYWHGGGVDPTQPGAVTNYRAWAPAGITGTGISAYVETSTGDWATLDGTSVYTSHGPVAGVVATSLTASPALAYACTSDKKIYSVNPTTGAATLLYNHDTAFAFIYWAKARLFAIDVTGRCYQLVGNPTAPPLTLASTDLVFTLPYAMPAWVGMETPGAVFLGNGSNVYALSVDNSGNVPTLSAPVTAAVLQPGEIIAGMATNLGFAVLSTSSGLRTAQVSGNQIVFGALEVLGTGGPCVAWRSGIASMCNGDLYFTDYDQPVRISAYGTPIGMQYAVHRILEGSFVGLAPSPSTAIPVPFTLTDVWKQGTALTPGWMATGLTRYATMEPKKFQSVYVRAAGSGGSVIISKVEASGTVTSLFTLDLSAADSVTLGLNEPEPLESLGLRFDLIPDETDPTQGPTLLGYQLKALPCPARQRLVAIPLLCFDRELRTSAPRGGHDGSAWERLSKLEDMEASGGTFRFTDYRTGESGECYIEQTQFQGVTPPSAKSSGFGGYLVLTIRKL